MRHPRANVVRHWLLGVLALLLQACVSHTLRTVDMSPPPHALAPPPANVALSIGVAIFDPNVPKDYVAAEARGISTEVRAAEANYFPYILKASLEQSGAWGDVRVVPRLSNAVDVTILGRIDSSDGEHLQLNIGAVDASGTIWFRKDYEAYASRYAYDALVPVTMDPFEALYRQIGADLQAHYAAMSTADIIKLRRIAQLRFANEMAPEAFGDYLRVLPNGRVEARRLPAEDDPMVERIDKVRDREVAFIHALDQHYASFVDTMHPVYQSYRKASYDDAVNLRRLREEALTRTVVGTAAVVGGLVTAVKSNNSIAQGAGAVGVFSGAALLKSGFTKRADARLRADSLHELGNSLGSDISPHTVALESETITLTGSVEEQYKTLREALSRAYRRDLGLPVIGPSLPDEALPFGKPAEASATAPPGPAPTTAQATPAARAGGAAAPAATAAPGATAPPPTH